MRPHRQLAIATGAVILFSTYVPSALAHAKTGMHSWFSGLTHPFTGLDHLAAMILLSVILANSRKPLLVLLPVLSFAIGCILGIFAPSALQLGIEILIACSLLYFGYLTFCRRQISNLQKILISGFVVAHGMAHGARVNNIPITTSLSFMFSASLGFSIGVFTLTYFVNRTMRILYFSRQENTTR